jgi:hypothetical protein
LTAKKVVEISHKKDGWKENVERKGLVTFKEWGFEILK